MTLSIGLALLGQVASSLGRFLDTHETLGAPLIGGLLLGAVGSALFEWIEGAPPVEIAQAAWTFGAAGAVFGLTTGLYASVDERIRR